MVTFIKCPYSMKKVPCSFTGEVLCEELRNEPKAVKHAKISKPEFELKRLHTLLKDAASKMEFNKLPNAGIETLLDKHHQLKEIDVDTW